MNENEEAILRIHVVRLGSGGPHSRESCAVVLYHGHHEVYNGHEHLSDCRVVI